MVTFETVDDAAWFLHAAGWSAGEVRLLYPDGRLRWSVTPTADGQDVRAEADTQTEAWRAAAEHGCRVGGVVRNPAAETR
jgi:hypothetical protein